MYMTRKEWKELINTEDREDREEYVKRGGGERGI
jgi:hypothetical protein